MNPPDFPLLAAIVALKPASYLIRIAMATTAFFAAIKVESVIGRVFGLVWLIIMGGAFLIVGCIHGTLGDLLLGLAGLGAAGYAWWYTRV